MNLQMLQHHPNCTNMGKLGGPQGLGFLSEKKAMQGLCWGVLKN